MADFKQSRQNVIAAFAKLMIHLKLPKLYLISCQKFDDSIIWYVTVNKLANLGRYSVENAHDF